MRLVCPGRGGANNALERARPISRDQEERTKSSSTDNSKRSCTGKRYKKKAAMTSPVCEDRDSQGAKTRWNEKTVNLGEIKRKNQKITQPTRIFFGLFSRFARVKAPFFEIREAEHEESTTSLTVYLTGRKNQGKEPGRGRGTRQRVL